MASLRTAAQAKKAISMYVSGLGPGEIATRLGVPRWWVYKRVKYAGVSRDRKAAGRLHRARHNGRNYGELRRIAVRMVLVDGKSMMGEGGVVSKCFECRHWGGDKASVMASMAFLGLETAQEEYDSCADGKCSQLHRIGLVVDCGTYCLGGTPLLETPAWFGCVMFEPDGEES